MGKFFTVLFVLALLGAIGFLGYKLSESDSCPCDGTCPCTAPVDPDAPVVNPDVPVVDPVNVDGISMDKK